MRYLCSSLGALALSVSSVQSAEAPASAAVSVNVSQGDLAKLGSTRRVAITSCAVEFLTSAMAEANAGALNKGEVSVGINKLQNVPKDALQQVVDRSCSKLREAFSAAGYEVISSAEITAQPAFQKLVELGGTATPLGMKGIDGGSLLFSESGLPSYLMYSLEEGPYHARFEGSASFDQAFPGVAEPPGAMKRSRAYDLPNQEIALAKALNALVVKASSNLRFGTVTAESRRDWNKSGTDHVVETRLGPNGYGLYDVDYTVIATQKGAQGGALLGVREFQTRLSIRTADGKKGGYAVRSMDAQTVPGDGDVVLSLASPVFAGSNWFTVEGGEGVTQVGTAGRASKLLGSLAGNHQTTKFEFKTRITDAAGYTDAATAAIATVQSAFVDKLRGGK